MTTAAEIVAMHHAHPDWTGVEIARAVGCGRGFVYKVATAKKLHLQHAKKRKDQWPRSSPVNLPTRF